MSRETEKLFKDLHKYMEEHSTDILTEDDAHRLANEFMAQYNLNIPTPVTADTAKTSDDYLELAYDASTLKDAVKYAKKALELDPNNYDAEVMLLTSKNTDDTKLTKDLSNAVQRATKHMSDEGYFEDDSIGHFWGIVETRPYMRLRSEYMQALVECGMIGKAREEGEELIRLCENDNLGVRYQLMHIYAYFEDEQAALNLHQKYDNYDETQMLLPLSIIYYKKGDFVKASKYLRKLNSVNKDLKLFLKVLIGLGDYDELPDPEVDFGYRPNTVEELMMEVAANEFLFSNLTTYIEWAYQQVKNLNKDI